MKAIEAIQLRRRSRREVVGSVLSTERTEPSASWSSIRARFLAAREAQIAVPPSGTSQATRVVNGPPPLCSFRDH